MGPRQDPERELEGKLFPLNISLCDFVATKKAMIATLSSPSILVLL